MKTKEKEKKVLKLLLCYIDFLINYLKECLPLPLLTIESEENNGKKQAEVIDRKKSVKETIALLIGAKINLSI